MYELSRIGKSVETDTRSVGGGEWLLMGTNGHRPSLWGDRHVLGLEGGGDCMTLYINLLWNT